MDAEVGATRLYRCAALANTQQPLLWQQSESWEHSLHSFACTQCMLTGLPWFLG